MDGFWHFVRILLTESRTICRRETSVTFASYYPKISDGHTLVYERAMQRVRMVLEMNNNGNMIIVSQEGHIQDNSGKVFGYVSENGFLYDQKHNLLGYVSQYSNVRDVGLHLVGHVNIEQHSFPYEAGKVAFLLLQTAHGI